MAQRRVEHPDQAALAVLAAGHQLAGRFDNRNTLYRSGKGGALDRGPGEKSAAFQDEAVAYAQPALVLQQVDVAWPG